MYMKTHTLLHMYIHMCNPIFIFHIHTHAYVVLGMKFQFLWLIHMQMSWQHFNERAKCTRVTLTETLVSSVNNHVVLPCCCLHISVEMLPLNLMSLSKFMARHKW